METYEKDRQFFKTFGLLKDRNAPLKIEKIFTQAVENRIQTIPKFSLSFVVVVPLNLCFKNVFKTSIFKNLQENTSATSSLWILFAQLI